MILPCYKNFSDKNQHFKYSSHYADNKISSTKMFDQWYDDFSKPYYNGSEKYDFFFRGMKEAKYKLFNSAQREWLLNNVSEWPKGNDYLKFLRSLIEMARGQKIFEKVLAYHQIDYETEADFPILSILQHYGAPSPLMDWSYNLDVALYFATEEVNTAAASDDIDGYFSVYVIKKSSQSGGLKNIFEYSRGDFPNLDLFRISKFSPNSKHNFVCYISDFEENKQSSPTLISNIPSQKEQRKQRPVTTYYNHNIIPQEGFFIFNPYPDKPLEECFSEESRSRETEQMGLLHLAPFLCYNIRKDLADYIRRKIKFKGVDGSYIYPQLKSFAQKVKEDVLNGRMMMEEAKKVTSMPVANKTKIKKAAVKKAAEKSKSKIKYSM